MHEYFETVDLPAADAADNDVLAGLGIYIPAQATIVEASITAVELYSNDVGSVALEVHTAAQAFDAPPFLVIGVTGPEKLVIHASNAFLIKFR